MDWRALPHPILLAVTIFALLGLSCSSSRSSNTNSIQNNSDQSAEIEALDRATTRLRGCLAITPSSATEPVSIRRIDRLSNRTRIELIAWAAQEPFDLQLPLYVNSRGRWLRGKDERVYIVDQECRQYGLYDVEFLQPRLTPGIIRIPSHQAITGAFIFPPLGPRARFGALVIGDLIIQTLFPAPSPSAAHP